MPKSLSRRPIELSLWIPRARLPGAICEVMGTGAQIVRSDSTGTPVASAALEALLAQVKRAPVAEMDEIVAGVIALLGKVMALSAEEGFNMNRTSVATPLE